MTNTKRNCIDKSCCNKKEQTINKRNNVSFKYFKPIKKHLFLLNLLIKMDKNLFQNLKKVLNNLEKKNTGKKL